VQRVTTAFPQHVKARSEVRTHILNGAADGVCLGTLVGELLGKAKVRKLHRIRGRIEQKILQFQVAVDHPLALKVVERLRGSGRREPSFAQRFCSSLQHVKGEWRRDRVQKQ
jgi:hypothetical protein